ncbi:MAG: hypothetical protein LUG18_11525 [Candidatus Azobacteroides sp.]|nr:hypothetical protein [Candidatus Azobacteroides sp.]
MKKKYDLPEENIEADKVNEPLTPLNTNTEMSFSPPLTEEELAESMSTEEFKHYWFKCIDEIFEK